ncbi:unnamed protein product [Periconia digitata]|uniref:Uncharacterized protein n=1 Tax=Periconia digitata TaxID=1303443 RepID=A0A9W4UCJ1_9PLEO|nr:unnamed protein product [Periconia digitata]
MSNGLSAASIHTPIVFPELAYLEYHETPQIPSCRRCLGEEPSIRALVSSPCSSHALMFRRTSAHSRCRAGSRRVPLHPLPASVPHVAKYCDVHIMYVRKRLPTKLYDAMIRNTVSFCDHSAEDRCALAGLQRSKQQSKATSKKSPSPFPIFAAAYLPPFPISIFMRLSSTAACETRGKIVCTPHHLLERQDQKAMKRLL